MSSRSRPVLCDDLPVERLVVRVLAEEALDRRDLGGVHMRGNEALRVLVEFDGLARGVEDLQDLRRSQQVIEGSKIDVLGQRVVDRGDFRTGILDQP